MPFSISISLMESISNSHGVQSNFDILPDPERDNLLSLYFHLIFGPYLPDVALIRCSSKMRGFYCSVEWQAKALCGELMMPYNATKHLSIEKIMDKYGVSYEAAVQRKRYN